MTDESKARLIFRFNELLDTLNNYKAHLKVASELEIREDLERFSRMFKDAAYDMCEIGNIMTAVSRITSYNDITTVEVGLELAKMDLDKEEIGCHSFESGADCFGEHHFCNECSYENESADCIKYKNSMYYTYGIYGDPITKEVE